MNSLVPHIGQSRYTRIILTSGLARDSSYSQMFHLVKTNKKKKKNSSSLVGVLLIFPFWPDAQLSFQRRASVTSIVFYFYTLLPLSFFASSFSCFFSSSCNCIAILNERRFSRDRTEQGTGQCARNCSPLRTKLPVSLWVLSFRFNWHRTFENASMAVQV